MKKLNPSRQISLAAIAMFLCGSVGTAQASGFGGYFFDTVSGVDLVNIDLGVGPEIGVNLNVAEHLTISPWVAYQYHYLVQVVDIAGFGDDAFSGSEHGVKFGVSVFFRSTNDQYRR